MRCCNKDGVTTDAVHVDTGGRLNVVQVNVAVLCDQVDHVVLRTHLNTAAPVVAKHVTSLPATSQVIHTRVLELHTEHLCFTYLYILYVLYTYIKPVSTVCHLQDSVN